MGSGDVFGHALSDVVRATACASWAYEQEQDAGMRSLSLAALGGAVAVVALGLLDHQPRAAALVLWLGIATIAAAAVLWFTAP